MNTTKNKSYISINLLIVAFLFIAFNCDSYKKAIISLEKTHFLIEKKLFLWEKLFLFENKLFPYEKLFFA